MLKQQKVIEPNKNNMNKPLKRNNSTVQPLFTVELDIFLSFSRHNNNLKEENQNNDEKSTFTSNIHFLHPGSL